MSRTPGWMGSPKYCVGGACALQWGMPRDPFNREKYHQGALGRQKGGRGIFRTLSEGSISDGSGKLAPSANVEFTLKRLRDPIEADRSLRGLRLGL
jgi:hypothetical protein